MYQVVIEKQVQKQLAKIAAPYYIEKMINAWYLYAADSQIKTVYLSANLRLKFVLHIHPILRFLLHVIDHYFYSKFFLEVFGKIVCGKHAAMLPTGAAKAYR